jgi:hypothetical protein
MAKKSSGGSVKAGRAAKSAASAGHDVRRRIHELTLRAFRDNDLSLRDIPNLVGEVVHGAAAGLNKAVPQSSRNVLRQVVDGLTDTVATAAKATKVTASSAGERGAAFIKKDLRRTAQDLGKLEDQFLTSLKSAGKTLTGAMKDEIDTIVSEAKRAGTKIRPAAESALRATDGRLMELGREAAGASARAAKSAVGTLLQGAGGFFGGLADAVTKSKPVAGVKGPARKKVAKKAGRKKARRA